MSEAQTDVTLIRRQHLEAVVVQRCALCGAPGAYHDDQSIKDGWPGCWVELSDPRNHKPVGEHCPNCGMKRPPDKALGTIWWREWLAKAGQILERASR